jgi:hypothetical protein
MAVMMTSAPAHASEPRLEGTFKDWTTYSRDAGGDKSCYAITKAKTMSPSSVRHGDIYFMVSNWRSGVANEQPSFLASYDLNNNIPPEASIGSKKAVFYAANNEAFIENSADEATLVRAMRGGSTMRMKARSKRGTDVAYSFSLSGVTAALKKAKDACR